MCEYVFAMTDLKLTAHTKVPAPRGVSEAARRDYDRAVIRALVEMRRPALLELAKR